MKHRNTIRLRALLAALVLCLGLLAGCGSASQPDDAAEEPFQSAMRVTTRPMQTMLPSKTVQQTAPPSPPCRRIFPWN